MRHWTLFYDWLNGRGGLKEWPCLELDARPTCHPVPSDNIEDVLPRAAKLSLINYYFKIEYKHRSKEELLKIADSIQINLTIDDVRFIEKITKDRNNWYWEKLQAGRVSSSQFKSVCEANLSAPDLELLTEICYPEKCVRVPDANETDRVATLSFISQMEKLHANFSYEKVGLILDQNYPYFAATPGGLCSCDCCGKYVVAIKCPFGSTKNVSIENLMQMKDSFMEMKNGAHCLRKDHRYYYELQMQMALCNTKFAWFHIWSTRFRITNRIWFNSKFWEENSQQALNFAKKVISVELMNSYFTHTY
ncbi:hypothetical protein HA402_003640 [Bradysia odoriphaga]|nr:hypothetical protein HA402_003640 [Bradysia odoriphaga]